MNYPKIYKRKPPDDAGRLIVGIDPGKTGGFAAVQYSNDYNKFYPVDMGTVFLDLNGNVDVFHLSLILEHLPKIDMIVLEKQHSYKMGRESAMKFGFTCGIIHAVCRLSKAEQELYVRPNIWQTEIFLQDDKIKMKTISKPKNWKSLTPQKVLSLQYTRDIFGIELDDHNIADAFMLVEYGRRFMKGDLNGK